MSTKAGGIGISTSAPVIHAGISRLVLSSMVGLAALGASAAALAADIPDSRNTQAVLKTGTAGVKNVFELKGDADWFRVKLKGGQNYAFTGAGAAPDYDACVTVTVRDAKGKVLRTAQGSGGSDNGLEFRSAKDGSFFATLKDCSTSGHPLNYRAKATADARGDPTTSATLKVGQTINGTLNWGVDTDFFRARLDRAKTYTVTASAGNTIEMEVTDAKGKRLFYDESGADARLSSIKVPTTGTYYVGVTGTDDFGGGYKLSLATP